MDDWIIYLRLSEFAAGDDAGTFEARADELHELAAEIGVHVPAANVRVENDVDPVTGRVRGASATRARDRVTSSNGLVSMRTRRPVYEGVMLDLQHRAARGVIVSDESRLARDWRDGMDLLDSCAIGQAGCVALDDDGSPRWVLSPGGGTRGERSRLLDRIDDARKYAEDISAKVAKGRRRWAGRSWHGGPRPWGYQVEQGTDEHARNLVLDADEAAAANLYADALLGGSSLKWCVADLRDRAGRGEAGTASASGVRWTSRSLVGALIKPTMAGLAVKGGGWVEAPWPPVIEREKWERLRALLLDPARRTSTRGSEPRWLVSSFATCGAEGCGKLLRVGGAGRGRGPAYVGAECGHIRRDAEKVDALIEARALALLRRPEVVARLRPPARPGVDRAQLVVELGKVDERKRHLADMAAIGRIDDDFLVMTLAGINKQEAALRAKLDATAAEPDVLAGFRESPADAVWAGLDVSRRRAVIRRLFAAVVVDRAGRGGRFDPALIRAIPRADVGD